MDSLGRYYTKEVVSDLLVQNLVSKFPKKILDLGIGNASLTLAAFKRWNNAKYFATEIEKNKVKTIKKQLSFITVFNYDSLKPDLSANLKIKYNSIDVAICNPPYVHIKEKEKYEKLLVDAGCVELISLKKLTSEIVFFAHNLSLLKRSGELGIIVSDSMVTGKEFLLFRKLILHKFDLRTVIQLPDKIFRKTEARTYILILSKSKPSTAYCSLYESDLSGKLSEQILVPRKKLEDRMDFQFYNFIKDVDLNLPTLLDIGATIKRGNFSYKQLRYSRLQFTHSTHLSNPKQILYFEKKVGQKYLLSMAKSGDMLMCRVGKRCVGRLGLIKSGATIISDCVYKISVPKQFRNSVWKSFTSPAGQEWIKAYAHGVCSQVISKSDLLNFPILFE